MRKVLLVGLMAAVMAVPAMAELSHNRDVTTFPIMQAEIAGPVDGGAGQRCGPNVYDSLYSGTAGYWLFTPNVGPLGYDDYDTVSGVLLSQVKFVGGVTAPGGILWFEFYTNLTSPTFVTAFGVQLPSSGWWIWTINMGSPFLVPHTGLMQIVANTNTAYPTGIAGAWFWTSSDAVICGSNILGYGTPPATFTTVGGTFSMVHDFAFIVPEPATLAMFGAGMLLVVRRRR